MELKVNLPRVDDTDKFVLQTRAIWNKMIVKEIANNPTVLIPTLKEVTFEACKEYIRSRKVSIWGPTIISSEDDLDKAASWFQKQVNNLYGFILRQGNEPSGSTRDEEGRFYRDKSLPSG